MEVVDDQSENFAEDYGLENEKNDFADDQSLVGLAMKIFFSSIPQTSPLDHLNKHYDDVKSWFQNQCRLKAAQNPSIIDRQKSKSDPRSLHSTLLRVN